MTLGGKDHTPFNVVIFTVWPDGDGKFVVTG